MEGIKLRQYALLITLMENVDNYYEVENNSDQPNTFILLQIFLSYYLEKHSEDFEVIQMPIVCYFVLSLS
jgi:hypothetical protein